jgi:hypothetical protein
MRTPICFASHPVLADQRKDNEKNDSGGGQQDPRLTQRKAITEL